MVLLVNPSFPATTFPEFIAYAKANPGKINMASPGIGTPMHVAVELLKMMTGINIVHVPYRGPAPAFTDLLAGQVQAFIITVPAAFGFVQGRQAARLGGDQRGAIRRLPDIPTVAELLPGFDATAWDGTCAPTGTPAEIVDKLNATITAGLADPQFKAQDQGSGRRADADDARRVRQVHRRRNREMGQGGQVLRRQAELIAMTRDGMKLPRRRFLHLAAGAAALPALPRIAHADAYPSRPVRMLVGSTPGAAPDVVARLFGQWLAERLGQPFVVENRPAGGGNLAAEPVVRAPPDGYMLLVFSASNAIDTTLLDTLNFDLARDIAPVAGLIDLPMLLTVNPSFPAKTLPEFIAYAKANPGKINIGTPPVGSPQYVSGALLEMMTDTKLAVIPYRGGPGGGDRCDRRADPGRDRHRAAGAFASPGRVAAPIGDHVDDALRTASRRSDHGRIPAGLRSEPMDRHRCAERHAGCGHQ